MEGLIRVFSEINKVKSELKLVLVGKEDYFYRRLKQYAQNFSNNIIFPGYVPDEELKALYAGATLYVFPSFYEGFGLPPLEAMARGLAVVSSNKTCLPEILGSAALYFNPDDETDMKNKIEEALRDEKLRGDLRNRGYEQIKKLVEKGLVAKYPAGRTFILKTTKKFLEQFGSNYFKQPVEQMPEGE